MNEKRLITHILIYRSSSKIFDILPIGEAMEKSKNSFVSETFDVMILYMGTENECEIAKQTYAKYAKNNHSKKEEKIKEHSMKVMKIIEDYKE